MKSKSDQRKFTSTPNTKMSPERNSWVHVTFSWFDTSTWQARIPPVLSTARLNRVLPSRIMDPAFLHVSDALQKKQEKGEAYQAFLLIWKKIGFQEMQVTKDHPKMNIFPAFNSTEKETKMNYIFQELHPSQVVPSSASCESCIP